MHVLLQGVCAGEPVESRVTLLHVIGAVFGGLAISAVAVRCWSRYLISKSLQADDIIIIVAAIIVAGLIYIDMSAAHFGVGKHEWDINPADEVMLLKVGYSNGFVAMGG